MLACMPTLFYELEGLSIERPLLRDELTTMDEETALSLPDLRDLLMYPLPLLPAVVVLRVDPCAAPSLAADGSKGSLWRSKLLSWLLRCWESACILALVLLL